MSPDSLLRHQCSYFLPCADPLVGSQSRGVDFHSLCHPCNYHIPLTEHVPLHARLICELLMAREGTLLMLESLDCSTEPLNKCLLNE